MDKALLELVKKYDNIVFFGGAGVSTESGIPDFRSVDGLYNQSYKYPPEEILSHTFFMRNPNEFYRFYREKMLVLDIMPNKAHYALAKLEEMGKVKAVITQNIDGLHQKAGSKKVLELHGSIHRNYCMACNKFYSGEDMVKKVGLPRCECGGIIKPDVVLYEEALDMDVMSEAINYIAKADMLIVGGTSLTVYPAAGLLRYFQGEKLVVINKGSTYVDSRADLVYDDSIGKVIGFEEDDFAL